MTMEKFKIFDRDQSFLEYFNHTIDTVRQLPKARLMDLQVQYYNEMLQKQNTFSFACDNNRDEIVTYESRGERT